MDRLEKFVNENREAFDDEMPDGMLWNRIDNELSESKSKLRKFNFSYVLWRAAAVLVIAASSWFAHDLYNSYKNNGIAENQLVENSDNNSSGEELMVAELLEAEVYYTSKISAAKEELNLYTADNPAVKQDVYAELQELDSVFVELKSDLKQNLSNQEVIEAMIQNYRVKLQILQDVLNAMKQNSNSNSKEKTTSHEI